MNVHLPKMKIFFQPYFNSTLVFSEISFISSWILPLPSSIGKGNLEFKHNVVLNFCVKDSHPILEWRITLTYSQRKTDVIGQRMYQKV